jgi:hypothetical protein
MPVKKVNKINVKIENILKKRIQRMPLSEKEVDEVIKLYQESEKPVIQWKDQTDIIVGVLPSKLELQQVVGQDGGTRYRVPVIIQPKDDVGLQWASLFVDEDEADQFEGREDATILIVGKIVERAGNEDKKYYNILLRDYIILETKTRDGKINSNDEEIEL